MERTGKYGLGGNIDITILKALELLRKSVYAPINKKLILLEEISDHIDSLRFFLQLAWETDLISQKDYALLSPEIENVGRIIGGWKRGLISKQIKPSTLSARKE